MTHRCIDQLPADRSLRIRLAIHREFAQRAIRLMLAVWVLSAASLPLLADEVLAVQRVEGQPLGANVRRVLESLELLGRPLEPELAQQLQLAARDRDAARLQSLLDPQVVFEVALNAESRVRVRRGPAEAVIQQAGYSPLLVKVVNASTVTKRLRVSSPQAGPIYAGVARLSMERQQQLHLLSPPGHEGLSERFLELELFQTPPMNSRLSGLEVEYAIVLVASSEAGKREATIQFDVEQGNQDLGFRAEVPVLFHVQPAVPVRLSVRDTDGQPTIARLRFQDARGHVYPPQAKRLAPDFFFQPHIYRADGEVVLLPPGRFDVQSSRGPEYVVQSQELIVPSPPGLSAAADSAASTELAGELQLTVALERWIDTTAWGFYSGDHHIHAAGCAHYTSPTEGVLPEDMFRQVKGEGLNVGCVLTWGPCFSFQRQFFRPQTHEVSDPTTVLKYDLEISGFGSQALGHVCLLNLQDQTYPGSEGTRGWPTWTTPVLRWAKEQGGVTGYAHSASGMQIDGPAAADRLLKQGDRNGDGLLDQDEAANLFLPAEFSKIDRDNDHHLSRRELLAVLDTEAQRLPNYAVPAMNGVGAMEIFVSTVHGVCDFISAMDTARIQEWNTWYHLLNCGFPLKVSGETDFPCMSSQQVGQGRVYVQLGSGEPLDFPSWCRALAEGRSYVSDGYAHAVEFTVNEVAAGPEPVSLSGPEEVTARAKVAFAARTPLSVAHGGLTPPAGRRVLGDTVQLHGERSDQWQVGGKRLVELIVNGEVVATAQVPADGQVHSLQWTLPVAQSSWVALRHFPQMHTNPVNVLVDKKPIRASRRSALWCYEATALLWENRRATIDPSEQTDAEQAFQHALATYQRIAAQAEH